MASRDGTIEAMGRYRLDASCQKYHDTEIYHCLKVLEALAYMITS